MAKQYDALALLSGGLDSILAVKLIQDQGLTVLGLHFTSPFFGKSHRFDSWKELYGIDVVEVDISRDYVNMMLQGPPNGFGKWLNPCVDCKIMMLGKARALMEKYGAKFIISGEVMGQRPMSQRRDSMSLIRKQAGVQDVLLRPLSALKLEPTPMEKSGLVDRSRLMGIVGRTRKPQLEMAKERYGFREIPTPAGGCVLAEASAAGRFIRVMEEKDSPHPMDFVVAQIGRQVWAGHRWLSMGRKQVENQRLEKLARDTDYFFKTVNFPGPVALGRPTDAGDWDEVSIRAAAELTASYASKAVRHFEATGEPVTVAVIHKGETAEIRVEPRRETSVDWQEPKQDIVKPWKQAQLEAQG
ncbi:tRNA(5-methylaminomethyl-2-thiouridylate) methyltransferase [Salidesulfovibrio onnuriiensis]|uniref:tRNA(5-methylaminomethyl-2-thiouridylate) methyltransferase n=1 Tax=Salidesulfovibrio onnuriiensis TaxID=2583823 RepID=UPI0011CC8A45|nr:tRNA(5-methylaminomethyl-2-thiouridylate) methyltransferase [Salidesulfovibrio onnuriiensis]